MKLIKPTSAEEKHTRTTVDTVELNAKLIETWRKPPFQRDFRMNNKVAALSEEIKRDGGVLPGIITLGVLDATIYLVDGQHRLEAFKLSGCDCGYVDVRTHFFATMGDMADEFVRLNSALVKLRPDDIMRGMEASTPALARIRKRCPFIGYDMVRRGDRSPVLSMSAFVRVWVGSRTDVPGQSHSAQEAVKSLTDEEVETAIDFLGICFDAWGRSPEYGKLWSNLNMSLCAWVYRRSHLGIGISSSSRATRLTKDQFRKGMMALSADGHYLDWLVGRNLGDRDRSPAYDRIRILISKRYLADTGSKMLMPQPTWAHHSGGSRTRSH